MKHTKKLTISAMAVALGAVFMLLGTFVQVLDLSAVAFASLLMVFIYVEVGHPYTWLVWLATTLVSFLIANTGIMWLVYFLVFGIYPIIKGYIERLPRVFWIFLKLLFVNLAMGLAVLGCQFIIGIPFFGDVTSFFGLPIVAVYIGLWLLLNVAFIAYDIFIVVMIRFYMQKIRPKIKRILK